MDSTNKDVISNDVNDYVIRDKDSELQSNKTKTSFDGEKIMSEPKLSTELSMLPDVVDCKGRYLKTLFFCFLPHSYLFGNFNGLSHNILM